MDLKHLFVLLLTLACGILPAEAQAQTPALTLTVHATQPTCGASNGEISFSATGGTPPYTYTFRGSNTLGQTDFAPVSPGVIPITVTDASGATASQTVTLAEIANPPTVTVTSYNNPTGCNTMDGSITVAPTSGLAPFLYTIDGINWQSSPTFTNLPTSTGPDIITVKDANGCTGGTFNAPTLVAPCPLRIWSYAYNELIFSCGGKTSYIHINGVTGGSGSYTYSLDGVNYTSNPDFDNLGAGWYTVYVNDGAGNILTQSFSIADECAVKATYAATVADCGSNDATVTVTATGGSTPYSYSLDGTNYQLNNNVFTGVASGTYHLWVKDLYGVTFTTLITVFDNCPLVTAVAIDATCAGNDGTITAQGSNGTAPYTYSLDGTNYQTSPVFPNLPAANYTVYIKDHAGNTNTTTVTVGNNCLQVTATPKPTSCERSNGTISITVTNGTPPYQYSLDGITFQNGNLFSNLPAGNYPTITVKDNGGLRQTAQPVTIIDIPGPGLTVAPNAATCLNNDGSILATGSGAGPFTYSLDGTNYQSSGQFNGLPSGPVKVWVEDANGCSTSDTYTVPIFNDLDITVGPAPTICEGQSVVLPVTSNGPQFTWTPATGLSNPNVLNPIASPSRTTQYTISSTWNVCGTITSVIVTVDPAPVPDAGPDQQVCYGASTQLQGSGGQCSWSPSTWLNNPTSATPTVQSPTHTITYSLDVTDANGCKSLQPATVTITVTQAAVFAGDDTTVLKGTPVQLAAVDLNNTGFTSWSWSPAIGLSDPTAKAPIATPQETTTYVVEAASPAGCSATSSVTIKVYSTIDILVPSGFTPNGDGHNDLLRAIPMGIREFRYFVVYNRWGVRVFQTTDPAVGWDGTLGGQPQPSDTFVWMAAGVDYQGHLIERKGTTILIR